MSLKLRPLLPVDANTFLASRALITGREFRAITGDSETGFHKKLRQGRLPQPAIREVRYVRWRSSDVSSYLADPQAWLAAARNGVNTLAEAA